MQEPPESCRRVRGSWREHLNSPWSSLLKGKSAVILPKVSVKRQDETEYFPG